ncbi:XRE family transcriptional regulator [Lachnoclostridium sp.]|uniref:XRE family transcriptional regulator n=1 Tax=Lachnoclostridium sp. TaxID=2028282 RepID=UPI00267B54DC|nr:XRE family transcriptional regulator [Lachnoclostridium sp.]
MGNIIQFNPIEGEKRFNGERLKIARIWRQLSAIQLADEAMLNRQTISMYENGKLDNPEFTTVQKLSEVLRFPVKFFLEDNKVNLNGSTTYFRSLLTTNKKYRVEQEDKIGFISVIFQMMNEYLSFHKLNLPFIPEGTSPQKAAIILREFWGLGNKPIDNIIYLVEANGMIVMEFETSTGDVDAFSHKIMAEDTETYLIGYSKNKRTAARIHFDVAHELGHILLHNWFEDLESIDKEDFKEMEMQAHAFASAFLLPEEEFIEDVRAYATNLSYYVELKKRWKVSIAAMIRRAKDLEIITSDDYSRLMRNMQKQGIRKVEPLDTELTTAEPSVIKQAINILMDKKVFTPNEFLEELSTQYGLTLYPDDVEALLGLKKGTLVEKNSPQVTISIKPRNN